MTTITLHAPEGSHVPARWANREVQCTPQGVGFVVGRFAGYVYPHWGPSDHQPCFMSFTGWARKRHQDGYYTTIRAISR